MTETLTTLLADLLAAGAGLSGFLEEIAGTVAILLLLLVLKRHRKRRKQTTAELAGPSLEPADVFKAETDTSETEPPEPAWGSPEKARYKKEKEKTPPPGDASTPASPAVTPQAWEIPLPDDPAGLFQRLKSGLSKTRQSLSRRFDAILSGNRRMDAEMLEEIEETLITADIGVPTTMRLMERIAAKADAITSADDFKQALKTEMLALVDVPQSAPRFAKPHVIMVVGVNGVGKTTTIGKLAARFSGQGQKVLLAAADTFRAAAADQLEIWARRAGADIVRHKDKSDPAAVAYDGVEAASARGADVVIIDTAGRLHTKVNLMEELKKIRRGIAKKMPDAPHETLLVVDATTGQNALSQAKLFNADTAITGIVLTKLDGTAKGGIVLAICDLLKVPIRYIGVGEGVEDLQEFDPRLFVDALF